MMDGQSSKSATGSISLDWLGASIVMATAVSLVAVHAPPRIRLIGLFLVALGILIGWLLVWLTDLIDARPSRRVVGTVAAILSFCSAVGCTWEIGRRDDLERAKTGSDSFSERLIEELKTKSNVSDVVPIDISALSTFRWHLSCRIRPLGHWTSPWPELFWIAEVVVATYASARVSTRIYQPTSIAEPADQETSASD